MTKTSSHYLKAENNWTIHKMCFEKVSMNVLLVSDKSLSPSLENVGRRNCTNVELQGGKYLCR